MKDYYDIMSFEPLKNNWELTEQYKESKASLSGTLTVWGDTIGRPGDTLYSLNEIKITKEGVIVFEFNNSCVQLVNPIDIYVNKMIIAVRKSDKIIWEDVHFNTKIEYNFDKSVQNVEAKIIFGEHLPNLDSAEPCFMLSAW